MEKSIWRLRTTRIGATTALAGGPREQLAGGGTPTKPRRRLAITLWKRCWGRRAFQRLELFGSGATGEDDADRSDLDFLVEFEPLAEGTYADASFVSSRASKRCFTGRSISSSTLRSATATSVNRSTRPRRCSIRLEAKKYLVDIQQAAALASEFVAGRTFAAYQATAMLRAAVERRCEIIGEALAKLAKVSTRTTRD